MTLNLVQTKYNFNRKGKEYLIGAILAMESLPKVENNVKLNYYCNANYKVNLLNITHFEIWKYAEGASIIAATIPYLNGTAQYYWTDNNIVRASGLVSHIEYKYKVKAYSNEASSLNSNEITVNGLGDLWKTTDTTSSEIKTIELSQNYPNPFNPTTQIGYQIHEDGFVSLKIFDSLGKEVQILESKNQKNGFYQVTFEASNFKFGVYYYKIQTNNYFETKKMLFLK